MKIRQYKNSDNNEVWQLFYNTVHTVNTKDYTARQLDAWAVAGIDADRWAESRLGENTLIAVDYDKIIGFGDITTAGHVNYLFIDKNSIRKGIGTAILTELEKLNSEKVLTTYASITARPFFEKHGYKVIRENEAERNGVVLKNYYMTKQR